MKTLKPGYQPFEVTHQCFVTDHLSYTSSLVAAPTRSAALKKFNEFARKRKAYPYMWNEVTLKDVRVAKFL